MVGWLADFLHHQSCEGYWTTRTTSQNRSSKKSYVGTWQWNYWYIECVSLYIYMYLWLLLRFLFTFACPIPNLNHILGPLSRLSNVFMLWVDSRFYDVWKSSRWFTMVPWLCWSIYIPEKLMKNCRNVDAMLMAIYICYTCRWNGRCWFLMELCSQSLMMCHHDFHWFPISYISTCLRRSRTVWATFFNDLRTTRYVFRIPANFGQIYSSISRKKPPLPILHSTNDLGNTANYPTRDLN